MLLSVVGFERSEMAQEDDTVPLLGNYLGSAMYFNTYNILAKVQPEGKSAMARRQRWPQSSLQRTRFALKVKITFSPRWCTALSLSGAARSCSGLRQLQRWAGPRVEGREEAVHSDRGCAPQDAVSEVLALAADTAANCDTSDWSRVRGMCSAMECACTNPFSHASAPQRPMDATRMMARRAFV